MASLDLTQKVGITETMRQNNPVLVAAAVFSAVSFTVAAIARAPQAHAGEPISGAETHLFFATQTGLLRTSPNVPTESSKSGFEGNVKLGLSPEWKKFVLDFDAGYNHSILSSTTNQLTTRSFIAEFSPRVKLKLFQREGWQLGPVLQYLGGGADHSYNEFGTAAAMLNQFRLGGKLLFQFGDAVLWRVGVHAAVDLNITNRAATALALDLQVGLSPFKNWEELAKKASMPPPEFAEVQDRSIRIYLGESLLSFPLGSSTLNSKAKENIALLAPVLIKNQKNWSRIRVEGHTDIRNGDGKNQELSENRAAAVKKALSENLVPAGRIFSKGFAATRPIDPAENEEAYLLNRRVEIWIDEISPGKIQEIMTELRQIQ
jgi:outer membrane protein OmpA-like peptidoglycan-associated protein